MKHVKSKSLTEVRELISEQPQVQPLLRDTMQGVLCTLSSRFISMQIKGEPIRTAPPASDDNITDQFVIARFVEPRLQQDNLNQKILSTATNLKTFLDSHLFQVKKCTDSSCYYCKQHPICMPVSDFASLSFVPVPLLEPSKDKYRGF